MSLDKLSGSVTPADVSVATDVAGLARLKTAARERSPEALEAVAKQFESLFLGMMLKSMRDANLGEGLFDSQAGELYQGMFDKQIALDMSRGKGLGIADMLVKQLSPKNTRPTPEGPIPIDAAADQRFLIQKPPTPALPIQSPESRALPLATTNLGHVRAFERPTKLPPVAPREVDATIPPERPSDATVKYGALPPLPAPEIRSQPKEAPAAEVTPPIASTQGAASESVLKPRTAAEWRPSTPEEFVREILPHAQKAADELGINPLGIIAQAALETGWGRKVISRTDGGSSMNLFGIKAGESWKGASATSSTVEFEGGIAVRKRENFRSYDNVADSFRDYVKLLSGNPRYREVLEAGADAKGFAESIGRSGYATDPHYASKIKGVLDSEPLRGALNMLKNFNP